MTAAATTTRTTVEAATITSYLLSRCTREKPAAAGFGHGWVWAAPEALFVRVPRFASRSRPVASKRRRSGFALGR
jgi:hypothetical protein